MVHKYIVNQSIKCAICPKQVVYYAPKTCGISGMVGHNHHLRKKVRYIAVFQRKLLFYLTLCGSVKLFQYFSC